MLINEIFLEIYLRKGRRKYQIDSGRFVFNAITIDCLRVFSTNVFLGFVLFLVFLVPLAVSNLTIDRNHTHTREVEATRVTAFGNVHNHNRGGGVT